MLERLERRALRAARVLAAIGLSALLIYAAMTLLDGTLRSLANHPIEAVRDLGNYYVAVAVACCFPLAFLERGNIAIKFAETFFGQRVSRLLDAAAAAGVEAAVVLIAWRLFNYGFQVERAHDVTFMLALPIGPFWIAVAALIAATAVAQALVVALEFARCFTGERVRERRA